MKQIIDSKEKNSVLLPLVPTSKQNAKYNYDPMKTHTILAGNNNINGLSGIYQ